jgi:transposase InsO family protein
VPKLGFACKLKDPGNLGGSGGRRCPGGRKLVDGRRFPSYEHAEHETLHWIGFYNEQRLHEQLGDLPPAEYEELNYKTDNARIVSTTPTSL